MGVSYVLLVEGGGTGRAEQAPLRRSFGQLLGKLSLARNPRVVCAGGRGEAYKDFCREHARGADVLLLVDSEGAVRVRPWEHVRQREGDGWERPDGAEDEQLHFMVPTMESWLVADPGALEKHYGAGYRADKLPKRTDVEQEPKKDLVAKLEAATRETNRKAYAKSDGFVLVGKIDPAVVRQKCPYAERFFQVLEAKGP